MDVILYGSPNAATLDNHDDAERGRCYCAKVISAQCTRLAIYVSGSVNLQPRYGVIWIMWTGNAEEKLDGLQTDSLLNPAMCS